jgi:hypothetical protein
MALDEPQKNKMMQTAPAKKEFHFAGGGVHFAQSILAATLAEATEIWHKTKVLIKPEAEIAAPEITKEAE